MLSVSEGAITLLNKHLKYDYRKLFIYLNTGHTSLKNSDNKQMQKDELLTSQQIYNNNATTTTNFFLKSQQTA